MHHVRNGVGIGGRMADLANPDGSGTRIHVPKDQVPHYTWRSYETVSRRFQESVFLGFLLAIGGTVTAAYFLRESGRTATEDQHIRGATLAPPEAVIALARASKLAYDFTLAGVPIFRDAETDHVLFAGHREAARVWRSRNCSTRSAHAGTGRSAPPPESPWERARIRHWARRRHP